MSFFTEKINKIDSELSGALSSGRVKLIAVSKYASDDEIVEAYNSGQRSFGENYVIPALARMQRLQNLSGIEWHLIGPLQTNKVKKAVGKFAYIQSVHSLRLAELIDRQASQIGIQQKVFLQVNLTGDKNGFDPDLIEEEIPKLLDLPNLRICGLMTMAPAIFCETIYQKMRLVFNVAQAYFPDKKLELSLGMSNDYQEAVRFGSSMIRLGRGLFTGD